MTHNILIIDSDPAFANMLKEGLESQTALHATVVEASPDVLTAVVEQAIDLVVVDANIGDMDPAKLITAVREAKPLMKVMVTTFVGQPVPDEITALGVQGVLSKPFFVGDLPHLVGEVLGVQLVVEEEEEEPPPPPPGEAAPAVQEEAPAAARAQPEEPVSLERVELAPTVPAEIISRLRAREEKIVRHLNDLNVEVHAEAILLTAGSELVAFTGVNLSRERAEHLAALVAQTAEISSRAATFLGEPDGRFEQSLHEGDSYRLYSYNLSQGIVLSLALSSHLPLGILRHQTRQTSRELLKYIK
ncbi:MAG: response regulator [Anaerolineae bacterium]